MAAQRPISDRLGIKPGSRVLLVSTPPGFSIEPLPSGARIDYAPPADTVLVFVTNRAEFADRVPAAARSLSARGQLWVGYPTHARASISGEALSELGASIGLDSVALFALDDAWSAVQMKRR